MARKKKNNTVKVIVGTELILGNKILVPEVENILTQNELNLLLEQKAFLEDITIIYK